MCGTQQKKQNQILGNQNYKIEAKFNRKKTDFKNAKYLRKTMFQFDVDHAR